MKPVKKFLAFGLAVVMMLSSSVAFATEKEGGEDRQSTYIIVEDDMLQQGLVAMPADTDTNIVTVSEINVINDERMEAVVQGDEQRYAELTELLHSYGVQEVTPSEVAELTGEDVSMQQSSETRNGITYETYNTTYRHSGNGKTYEILRILATPDPDYSRDTVLYKSGDITIQNSKTAKANAMTVIGAAASASASLANDKIGIAQTVYGFFKDVNSGLSSTSEITNIKASYTWNTALACSFIYVRENPNAAYNLRGLYHKATASIGVTIPKLSVSGDQDINAYMLQKSHSGTATPVYFDSTKKAVEGFINGKQYQSSVTRVTMTGVEKKTIKDMRFSLPMTPLEAGY